MRHFLSWTLALLAVFFGLVLSGCKKERGQAAPEAGLETAAGAEGLRVLGVTPLGQTAAPHESQTIVVLFDRPMVELEELPEGQGKPVLKFGPPFTGKTRWLGSHTLTFTPDKRFPYATEIGVTIPAGLRALDGASLKEDYRWSFRTIPPRLLRHFPQDRQKSLGLDTEVLLIFNQAMNRDTGREYIGLISVDENGFEADLDFRVSHPSSERLKEESPDFSPSQALVVEARERLRPGLTYRVEIKKGLPAREGSLRTEEDLSFSFGTFGPFQFKGLAESEGLDPRGQLQFLFSNPVSYREFVGQVRFEPAVEIPDYYGEWHYGNEALYLSLDLEPDTQYSVRVGPELKDEFGNRLGREVEARFSTSSFPPSLSMTTGYGILEGGEEAKYPLSVLNIDSVTYQAAPLKKEMVVPLLIQPKVFWSDKKFLGPQGFFQHEKTLTFKWPRNKPQVVPLNLAEALAGKYGFVFLQVDTGQSENEWSRFPKVFLQVTELGISGKFSPENTVVWVTELRSGLPVPEAAVEIRDDLNKVIWRGKTDESGKAQAPGWKSLGMKSSDPWSEPRQWIFASRGRDLALSSSEWGTGIDPYRFRIAYDWAPQPAAVRGSVFSERGIYRAGEEVHLKGIIRNSEGGQWTLPSAREVDCEIRDPFRKTVLKSKTALDEYGSFALNFESPAEASLGFYEISATVPPEESGGQASTLTGSFRIEAFRPAEFEVHLKAERESVAFGQDYGAEVRANYLFGGAMAGQPVSWHLRLNPGAYSPPGWTGFIFGNELEWGEEETAEESRLAASSESVLDREGKLRINLPLRVEKEKDSALATLEATVVSPSRRSISNRIQTRVHRGEYYVGLKPATSFLIKGETLSVEVVAPDQNGRALPEKKIGLKLVKREWKSARLASAGGRFRWVTEKEDTEVGTAEVRTKNEPATVSFKPGKTGFYYLLASGSDGFGNRITTTTSFYVTGPDYVPWERRDDDSIELVADAENYQPGQQAKILVKSPYEKAKALVTVERESVLESRILDIGGTSSQVEIPIRSEYIPNVFVCVLLVQGRRAGVEAEEDQDLGKPSFKIGYVNLSVDPAEKRLDVEVQKEKEGYRPKEPVTLRFKVKNSLGEGQLSSLSVAVVDLGVLNLIGYQMPDPFSQFYGEKSLSVRTSETRIHVVGQRDYGQKGEEVGGGAEAAAAPLAALSEVELRGDFKSTAYWNPSLVTDGQGEAQVTFTLPDNLTTFRVMAVAQTKDSRFGQDSATFRVSKKLLLQPALPRFARVGDVFEGGVVVHNLSSSPGNALLSVKTEGIRLAEEAAQKTVSLAPGQSREVLFHLLAEGAGLASFSFRVAMGEETDGLEIRIPLTLPRPTETVAFFGETRATAEEKIALPADVFPEQSLLEVRASPSALLGLKGSLDELTDYPYLCLEQRLSALLPYILAPQVLLDFGITPLGPEELRRHVGRGLQELYSYQKESGGFGLWPDSPEEAPFLSAYAGFALIKAAQTGAPVDSARLERAVAYLSNFMRQEWRPDRHVLGKRAWQTAKAFSLYVLSLAKKAQPAYAEKLFTEKDDLSLFGRTLLLKALHHGQGSSEAQGALFQDLWNKVKVTAESAHFEEEEGREGEWVYSSSTRTTAFILQTAVEIGGDHPLLSPLARWLVEKLQSGSRLTTQENLYAFYALNEYYKKYERGEAGFKAKITLAGKVLLEEAFRPGDRVAKRSTVKLSELPSAPTTALAFRVAKSDGGILYYGGRMTYAPRRQLSARDEGIAVSKRIESLDGRPVEVITPGSLVVVAVDVAVPHESLYVVVDDPLPAGLEAVNPAFLTESEEQDRIIWASGEEADRPWRRGFNHIEMHDDRVLLFADLLSAGVHSHKYLARATTFGTFGLPGTRAERMYAPEVFGRSLEKTIKIALVKR